MLGRPFFPIEKQNSILRTLGGKNFYFRAANTIFHHTLAKSATFAPQAQKSEVIFSARIW